MSVKTKNHQLKIVKPRRAIRRKPKSELDAIIAKQKVAPFDFFKFLGIFAEDEGESLHEASERWRKDAKYFEEE